MAALFLALSALALHLATAQWPSMGMPGMGMSGMGFQPRMGNQFAGNNMWGGQGVFNRRHATCSFRPQSGDQLRVTLSEENPGWGNWGVNLRMVATVTSMSISGTFQLAISQFGRIEDGCTNAALGSIYGPRQTNTNLWMNFNQQNQQPERGILGSSFTVSPGQTATLSEVVPDLTYDEILGNAVMLCQTQSMANGQCMDPILMCCKLGKDMQPATQPLGNSLQQGAFGGNNMMTGGLNNGLNTGLNTGFNTGFNTGLNSGLNTGLGTGLTGGVTNTGLTSTNNANNLPLSGSGLFSGK